MNNNDGISWSIDQRGYVTLIRGTGPRRVRIGAGKLPEDLLNSRGTKKGDKKIDKYVSRLAVDFFDERDKEAQFEAVVQLPTIQERLTRHLELHPGLAKLTRRQYEIAVEKFVDIAGDKPIDKFTRQDANDYVRKLADCGELSNTIARRVQCLKRLFRAAIEEYEEQVLLKNPFDKTKSQNRRPTRVKFRYVPMDEFDALMEACDTTPRIHTPNRNGWKCLFGLCRLAGCRRSEALRSEWDDVDFETKMIWIGNKKTVDRLSAREGMRKVPLHPKLTEILSQRKDEVGDQQDLIVGFDQQTGNLHRTFQSICKEAGIEAWPEPYQNMRRSMVTDGHKAGLAGSDIENVFGHGVDVSRQYYLMQSAERSRDLLWGNDAPKESDQSET